MSKILWAFTWITYMLSKVRITTVLRIYVELHSLPHRLQEQQFLGIEKSFWKASLYYEAHWISMDMSVVD